MWPMNNIVKFCYTDSYPLTTYLLWSPKKTIFFYINDYIFFDFYKCPEIFISAKALTLQQFTDRLNNHSRSLGSLEFILKAHVFYFILGISDVYIFFSYLVSLWRSHSLFNVNGILGCVCKLIFNDKRMFCLSIMLILYNFH